MKLFMVSLGCDKNLVDSERMLSLLADHGFELTDDENEAEVAVVNTCCFIDEAKKESIEEILGTPVTLQKGESFDSDTNILTVSFSYDESLTLEQQENMLAKMQETYPDNNVDMLESNEVSPSSGREFFGKCDSFGVLLCVPVALAPSESRSLHPVSDLFCRLAVEKDFDAVFLFVQSVVSHCVTFLCFYVAVCNFQCLCFALLQNSV